MENIYADFGKIIDKRYIKREKVEQSIVNRVGHDIFGSYSLVGLPRMGKSTVVYHIFKDNEDDIVIFLTVSEIENVEKFFNKLSRLIYRRLKKMNLLNDEINEIYNAYIQSDFTFNGIDMFLEFIEVVVEESDKKIITILDEFDSISEVFKNNVNLFQKLREMAIQARYNTAFVFLSRRLIEEIEIKLNGVSNLRGVLKVDYIKPYNDSEITKYFEILSDYFDINNDIIGVYKKTTGFYPFLMDILSYCIVESLTDKKQFKLEDIEKIYQKNKVNEFYTQYSKLKELLIEENLFDTLTNFIFKNDSRIEQINIQKLKNYGLIMENEIFCDSFKDFIKDEIKKLEIDTTDITQLQLYQLKDKIENLVLNINDTMKNNGDDEIFIDTPSLPELNSSLTKPAINKTIFDSFSGAMYKTLFERTAKKKQGNSRNLLRLPDSFKKEHNFVKLVDSLRHNFGGHDTRSPNWKISNKQMNKSDLLRILKGNTKELQENDREYLFMQIKVLEMFYNYLDELHKSL